MGAVYLCCAVVKFPQGLGYPLASITTYANLAE